MMGRQPGPDDLIAPSRKGKMRVSQRVWEELQANLVTLGYRKRRFHDLRRTFISLARSDGARPDILKLVTHGPSGDIMDIYTTLPWEAPCAEVAKLKVQRRVGQVSALPRAVQVGEKTLGRTTGDTTVSGTPTAAMIKTVGGEGFEPPTVAV